MADLGVLPGNAQCIIRLVLGQRCGYLPHAKDIVPEDCLAVPYQEYATLFLVHQQIRRLLPGHATKVPARRGGDELIGVRMGD